MEKEMKLTGNIFCFNFNFYYILLYVCGYFVFMNVYTLHMPVPMEAIRVLYFLRTGLTEGCEPLCGF